MDPAEEEKLRSQFLDGSSLDELAAAFRRRPSAIRSHPTPLGVLQAQRIPSLSFHLGRQGEPPIFGIRRVIHPGRTIPPAKGWDEKRDPSVRRKSARDCRRGLDGWEPVVNHRDAARVHLRLRHRIRVPPSLPATPPFPDRRPTPP